MDAVNVTGLIDLLSKSDARLRRAENKISDQKTEIASLKQQLAKANARQSKLEQAIDGCVILGDRRKENIEFLI